MQFTFVAASFFLIYYGNKTYSYAYLSLIILASWALTFVLSASLIVEVDIAINKYTQLYFRSFYSHLLFYLFGVLMCLLSSEEKARDFVKNNVTSKASVMTVLNIISTFILVFIMLRPSLWQTLGF